MICIKSTKREALVDPYYELHYKYMIGDANGDTVKISHISLNNPYIERYVELLNNLTPLPGHWGIVLEFENINKQFKFKRLSKKDYNFLIRMMFCEKSDFVVEEENKKYSYEFHEAVRSDFNSSFLVFEGIYIYYIDEFGNSNLCEIIPDDK